MFKDIIPREPDYDTFIDKDEFEALVKVYQEFREFSRIHKECFNTKRSVILMCGDDNECGRYQLIAYYKSVRDFTKQLMQAVSIHTLTESVILDMLDTKTSTVHELSDDLLKESATEYLRKHYC